VTLDDEKFARFFPAEAAEQSVLTHLAKLCASAGKKGGSAVSMPPRKAGSPVSVNRVLRHCEPAPESRSTETKFRLNYGLMAIRHRSLVSGSAVVAVALLVVGTVGYYLALRDASAPSKRSIAGRSQPTKGIALSFVPRTASRGHDAQRGALIERVDPAKDPGWDTEVLAEAAKHQLDRLAVVLTNPTAISPAAVAEFTDSQVVCAPLRPHNLTQVFSDGSVSVWRQLQGANATTDVVQTTRLGHSAMATVLQELVQPLRDASDVRVECKVVGVDRRLDHFETTVYFHCSGCIGNSRTQQNATWTCRWSLSGNIHQPLLLAVASDDFEEIRSDPSGGIQFVEDTSKVLGAATSYREQLARGIDYWRSRLTMDFGVDLNGNQGIAIGDVNGDELDDIYVCQQGGLPNRLYVRNRDGTLRDMSTEAGVDWLDLTRSALLIDIDNDTDQDLLICQGWYLLIMLNSGDGHFQPVTKHRCRGDSYSLAAADYDLDGDLDVYLCGRDADPEDNTFVGILGSPLPYHDANNGAPNMLYENDGHGRFRDVTSEVGLDENNRRFSYATAWADYDNDGDMDLYVANDFGRNNLYQNQGGHFHDVAAELGVEDISAGMGATWGDYDSDGLLDLYVSNMFSSAGNRIAYQRNFRTSDSTQTLTHFQRHARGNSLFRNTGSTGFEDVSQSSGVMMGRWAWGAKFVDLNNDSREDLYVANGFVTASDTGDL
jgi:hypothetical protein